MPDSTSWRKSTAWMLGLGLVLVLAPAAFAQEESTSDETAPATHEAAPGASASKAGKKEPATGGASSGNVKLNEVEIRGELEKPKIFFILPKAQRDAETRQRRIRFYPDILEPLDKDRFEEEARVLYQHGIPAE